MRIDVLIIIFFVGWESYNIIIRLGERISKSKSWRRKTKSKPKIKSSVSSLLLLISCFIWGLFSVTIYSINFHNQNLFIPELKVLGLSFSLYTSVLPPNNDDDEGEQDGNNSTSTSLPLIPPSLFPSFQNKVRSLTEFFMCICVY